MAALKKTPPVPSPRPATVALEGGIRISITNQHGQRYRYRACAVSLNIRKGALRVIENDGRCYVWFEQCDLEVRDTRRTVLFRLNAGAASNQPDAEIVILAELVRSTPKAGCAAQWLHRRVPPRRSRSECILQSVTKPTIQ
jgi:hypothetical protein